MTSRGGGRVDSGMGLMECPLLLAAAPLNALVPQVQKEFARTLI